MRFQSRTFSVINIIALVSLCSFTARTLPAIEFQLGDPLPELNFETTTGTLFDLTAPGEGVTVILFDGPGATRSPAVCEQLRSAFSNPTLAETSTRLLYVLSRSESGHAIPDHVISVSPTVVVAHDTDGVIFDAFNIIVLPTIIVTNETAEIIYVSAGITPRFEIIVNNALLLAAGLIDSEAYNQILNPKPVDEEGAKQLARATRIARMASRMANRGMTDHAHKMYLEALEIDPACLPALLGCGDLAFTAGELKNAEHLYARALDADPLSVEAALGLSQIYLRQGDDRLEEAESLIRNVLKHSPKIASAYDLMGQIHVRRGEADQAKECFLVRDDLLEQQEQRPETPHAKKQAQQSSR